jgi:UDP-glucose 6-dehydrogenase
MPGYEAIDVRDKRMAYDTMRNYVNGDCGGFDLMMPWLRSMTGNVLIVGHGTVGTNLGRELGVLDPMFCDKYKNETAHGHYRFAFICVDTPLVDGTLDTSEVWNAIGENDADVYVIKSTVPVGTTDKLRERTGKRIVFSPEYYGATQHCNNFEFDFTILGGDRDDCVEVIQLLQKVYDGRHTFRIVDAKTAELAKLMENSWLATKVSFCNQFYDIAESKDVCYEELRELFILDPRVNPSHTFVNRSQPYWDSHCLNKDVPEASKDAPLLQSVIAFNESQKVRS